MEEQEVSNNREINTSKFIEDYLWDNAVIVKAECIKSTETITSGKIYKTIYFSSRYHPSISHRDGIYIPKYGVINDKGLYIEVSSDKFKFIELCKRIKQHQH